MAETINFELRFPTSYIAEIAGRYSVKAWKDDEVEPIRQAVLERGYYTRDEFLRKCRWKSARTQPRCEDNDEETVREATRLALSTSVERLRIEVLTLLRDVSWPTASVLLHFGHHENYPILDFCALWSLGIDPAPAEYTFEFWWRDVEMCRSLAARANVDMRTIDRALWQYSKEHQGAAGV
jgi:hypothetical protein